MLKSFEFSLFVGAANHWELVIPTGIRVFKYQSFQIYTIKTPVRPLNVCLISDKVVALGHVKRGGGGVFLGGFSIFFLNILIILLSCR